MPLEGEESGTARARECAKAFLHQFVMLSWDFEYIPTHASSEQGWEARIAATVEDDQGRQYPLKPQHLAILQPGQPPAIFAYAELAAEIRRENGLEPTGGGDCLQCGKPLSPKAGAGRDRHYCKTACRVAHHRQLQREKQRETTLQSHSELNALWERYHVQGQLLTLLQGILIEQGQQEAQAATEAVLTYVREELSRQQPNIPEPLRRRKRHAPL